tara:strand:- start:209 stop:538 length:330 start_codon:yes stop_codon:yes gene_type:complete
MCESCYSSWQKGNNIKNGIFVFGSSKMDKHTCPACNKSQLMECPICYENKSKNEMIESDNCTHSICCTCFSKSFKSNPIIECPMCRAQFNRTIERKPHPNDFEEINEVL